MNNQLISIHFWFGDHPSARILDMEVIAGGYLNPAEPTVVYCDGILPTCTINENGARTICNACIARTRYNFSLLNIAHRMVPLSEFIDRSKRTTILNSLPNDVAPAVLNQLSDPFEGIGRGALSSAISFTRDMNLVDDDTVALARKLLATSLIISDAVTCALRNFNPQSVVVHNGRLAEYHAVYQTCRHSGVDTYTHEVCSPEVGWYLFRNGRVHDRESFAELIRFSTLEVPLERLESVSKAYLSNKRIGTVEFENYTKQQKLGNRSYTIDDRQQVIAVFTSSEDEFASIGPEWAMPFFESQHSAIKQIVNECHAHDPSILFVVRMHPNMARMHRDDLEPYRDLVGQNVHVVDPESSVDSYSVLDDADIVLTFGSTIGCEATYWGKPVVQVGHSLFEHLDVCYIPKSQHEIVRWLLSPPPPKAKSNVYPYIYTICVGGYKYLHVDLESSPPKYCNVDMMIPSFGAYDKFLGLLRHNWWSRFVYSIRLAVLCRINLIVKVW